MKRPGGRQTLVVGMGHGTCTCEGAAFKYVLTSITSCARQAYATCTRLVYLTNQAHSVLGVGG